MGYSDFSIVGSDMAADASYALEVAVVQSLEKTAREKGNEFNTSGAANVAMIIDEILPRAYIHFNSDKMIKLLERVSRDLDLHVQAIKLSKPKQWRTPQDRNFHLKEYKRLHGVVKKYIRNCNKSV